MMQYNHGASAVNAHRDTIYYPEKRPGYVAWVTAFDYGNSDIGLSFKETLREENKGYKPARLEMGEAVGAPVSYCSVECGSAVEESYRVYMRSVDNGKSFTQTGRCQLESGSFCNAGFPDGRIIGFDVPRINEQGTGWCDYIDVRESLDGGSTWTRVTKLLQGTAPYLWRSRRLSDGTIILLASLYGTPWGEGHERTTRNTMLPNETYIAKIQTFFLTTTDGRNFSGPHYVLPGIGAHEYDVVECADKSLLFIAGDVQATPVARQRVERRGDIYINGTMFPIRRGAPPQPDKDPQGGFVPETMVMLPGDIIVGSRRNKPYSCSNDYGESWYEIDGLPPSLYQPFMHKAPNGDIINFGHFGGDLAFGQEDMWVGADIFCLDNKLPGACSLSLTRLQSEGGVKYINGYSAQLKSAGRPVRGEEITFRFKPVWNSDGSVNTAAQSSAAIIKTAITDENGSAEAFAPEFDNIPDIHFYYNVDVIYAPKGEAKYRPCQGPEMCEAALTPHRKCRYPYSAYFAEDTLFISPELLEKYPNCLTLLHSSTGSEELTAPLGAQLTQELLNANVLYRANGALKWYKAIHSSGAPSRISPMAEGDWYI